MITIFQSVDVALPKATTFAYSELQIDSLVFTETIGAFYNLTFLCGSDVSPRHGLLEDESLILVEHYSKGANLPVRSQVQKLKAIAFNQFKPDCSTSSFNQFSKLFSGNSGSLTNNERIKSIISFFLAISSLVDSSTHSIILALASFDI